MEGTVEPREVIMKTRRWSGCAALLGLLVVLGGCPARPSVRGPQQAKVDEKTARLRLAEGLLRMVPASASGALVLDMRSLYRAWHDLERAAGQTEEGRLQLQQARRSLSRGSVAFPLTVEALERLGVDAAGPVMMYGEGEHWVALFHVNDAKRMLGTMARGEPGEAGKWIKKTSRGRTFHKLGKEFCHSKSKRMICASREDLLHIALQHRPERSVWHALTPRAREDLATAGVFYFVRDKQFNVTGTLRVEQDGLSAAMRILGTSLDPMTRMYQGMKPRFILGLARGHSQMYGRINLGAVFDLILEKNRSGLEGFKAVGLHPEKLRKELTGELLQVEQPGGEVALVLGCRDPGLTRMLTALAATGIQQLIRHGRSGFKLTVAPVTGSAGSDVRIHVSSTRAELPLEIKVRLKAGKAGVILGTEKLVLTLAGQKPPPVTRFTRTLNTPTDRQAFGPRAAMALRTPLGDPVELAASLLPMDRLL